MFFFLYRGLFGTTCGKPPIMTPFPWTLRVGIPYFIFFIVEADVFCSSPLPLLSMILSPCLAPLPLVKATVFRGLCFPLIACQRIIRSVQSDLSGRRPSFLPPLSCLLCLIGSSPRSLNDLYHFDASNVPLLSPGLAMDPFASSTFSYRSKLTAECRFRRCAPDNRSIPNC